MRDYSGIERGELIEEIYRKEAEIERLRSIINESGLIDYEALQADNERLQAEVKHWNADARTMDEIRQHIYWLRGYVACMNENNWLDMKNQCQRKLRELKVAVDALDRPRSRSRSPLGITQAAEAGREPSVKNDDQ